MRRNYLENKRMSEKSIRAVSFGCFPVFIICAVILLIGLLSSYEEESNAAIIFTSGAIIFLVITFIYFTKISSKLGSVEKGILKIITAYMKEIDIKLNDANNIISNIFISYKLTQVKENFEKYYDKNINLIAASRNLAKESNDARYFVIYMLMDISAIDGVLSIKEELKIEEIYQNLNINNTAYKYIKNAYLKKGLKEERKIIEEQNRKKIAESFLPYNAYKVLGVSPTVTKVQLKKVYRALAKKYHPDKYYGQSEEIIQKAEDKFQEILEAYEIIIKYKKF